MSLPAGYVSRPAAWEDLDVVVDLLKACDLEDVGVADPQRELVAVDWRRDGFDFGRHTLMVLAEVGVLAAYAETFGMNPELSVDVHVRVHPEYRGRGLGAALLAWSEERAAELVPAGVGSTLYHAIPTTDDVARRMLSGRGYEPARIFWHMVRDLSGPVEPPVIPDGCRLDPYVHDRDVEPLYVTLEESFADHWGFESYPRDAHERELAQMDPSLIWVARWDGEMVGTCVSEIVEDTGWVHDLGVRPAWRGRGIAKALLLRSFAAFVEHGVASTSLNVDSTNESGATRLYGAVGMHVHRAWEIFGKPLVAGVS